MQSLNPVNIDTILNKYVIIVIKLLCILFKTVKYNALIFAHNYETI